MSGPAGTPCPTCGLYAYVNGCKPWECMTPAPCGHLPVFGCTAERCALPGARPVAFRDAHVELTAPVEAPFIASRPEINVTALREDLVAAMSSELGPRLARDAVYGPVEHPAPWRWDEDGFDLRAANGALLIKAEWDDIGTVVTAFVSFSSPRVKVLTEMAPDLEEFARDCANGDAGPGDRMAARASELLARLDERSKAVTRG